MEARACREACRCARANFEVRAYNSASMSVALFDAPPLTLPETPGPYGVADYANLPDEPRCELIFGDLYVLPSPLIPHQVVATKIWQHLDGIAEANGGYALLAPLDVHLASHSVVQPDVIYVSADRLSILGDKQGWIQGAPDLLVEILSPGTARRDRVLKLDLYARSGVGEYWIVDPAERQIEFLGNENGRFVVALPTGAVYRSGVRPEISLDLEAFWGQVARRFG